MFSMPCRRRLLALVALSMPLWFSPSIVGADDDEPSSPFAGDPEAHGALVNGFSMALVKEELPKEWVWLEADAAGPDAKALADALTAIAKDKGVATSDEFNVKSLSVAGPDGAKIHYAYIDLGAPSQTFVDALKAEGAKKSWSVRAMGTDRHILVTAAPDSIREKAEGLATAFAARLITKGAVGTNEEKLGRKIGLARLALQLDAKSAAANFVFGYYAKQFATSKRPIGDLDPAIAHLRAALDKSATNPLGKRDAVIATGNLGQAILNKGGPSSEARDLLKDAVSKVADLPATDRNESVGFRYDLACAHARLKEVDEAFVLLTAVLEDDAKDPTPGISEIWREKDDDLTILRADPRFKKLLEKYPAPGGDETK